MACGGHAREVAIRDREAAERVAAESLGIVFGTLGYRGGRPLVLQVVVERIAAEALVHFRLRPSEVALMLRRWGYAAEVVGAEVVVGGREGGVFVVAPEGSADEGGYFGRYAVRACFPRVRREVVEEWSAENRLTRAFVEEGGGAMVVVDLDFAGGVTEEWIDRMIARFDEDVRLFQERIGPDRDG